MLRAYIFIIQVFRIICLEPIYYPSILNHMLRAYLLSKYFETYAYSLFIIQVFQIICLEPIIYYPSISNHMLRAYLLFKYFESYA